MRPDFLELEIAESLIAQEGVIDTLGVLKRLGVIADGVETAAQLAVLRSLRCDEMQGGLFGPPRPAEQLAALPGNHRKPPNFEQISTGQTT